MKDIRHDKRIQQADIIHLQETWNIESENSNLGLDNYSSHFVNIGPGKGLATYYKENFTHVKDIATEKIQITKFSSEYVDSINLYRTQKGITTELNELLSNLITANKVTVITGDFNICSRVNWNNRTSTHLKSLNFKQYQLGPTQIRGGHIDHLYIKHAEQRSIKVETERYSLYYSDHDGICIILSPANPDLNN
jgi:exonuclease III